MTKKTHALQAEAENRCDDWSTGLSMALEGDPRSLSQIAREAGVGNTTLRDWRDRKAMPSLAGAIIMRRLLAKTWPKRYGRRLL